MIGKSFLSVFTVFEHAYPLVTGDWNRLKGIV